MVIIPKVMEDASVFYREKISEEEGQTHTYESDQKRTSFLPLFSIQSVKDSNLTQRIQYNWSHGIIRCLKLNPIYFTMILTIKET